MAVPLMVLPGGSDGVALPRPLSPSDASRVRRIFIAQSRGDMAAATRETNDLESNLLLGHILADRYLGQYHVSTSAELSDWLNRFGDQPDATSIQSLLAHKLPKGSAVPPVPRTGALASATPIPLTHHTDDSDGVDTVPIPRNLTIDRKVLALVNAGNDAAAVRVIDTSKDLTPAYRALLRGDVARVLFTQNHNAQALNIAKAALERTPADQQVAHAGLMAGFAAWRLDLPDLAAEYFVAAARAPLASVAQHAKAAFWAARATRRIGDPIAATYWLREAATQPRTLHGLLARRALRMTAGVGADRGLLTQADVDAIASTTHGLRAFALLQVGLPDQAEAELRMLWPDAESNPAFGRALRLVASAGGLVDLAAQLAALSEAGDGHALGDLNLPMPALHPSGGFRIDPALVYALTRLESDFDSAAVSPSGARGLMQIMPNTAQFITGDPSLGDARLHDASFNLALGQRYFAYLATQEGVDGDLIRVLASYNAGPGGFAKWSGSIRDNNDPLLFLEAIPNPETRAFVRHALAYAWIYAARLGRPAPGLDALVAGEFPRFTRSAETGTIFAAAPRIH